MLGESTYALIAESKADLRIFDAMMPDHLKRVLHTSERRNVALFQILMEETGHIDKNRAIDMIAGFKTIGVADETGLWAHDPKFKGPEKAGGTDALTDVPFKIKHERPAWQEDYAIDFGEKVVESDMATGRFDEVNEEDVRVKPMKAFGLGQNYCHRTKNNYSR